MSLWKQVADTNYSVSDAGELRNDYTGNIIKPQHRHSGGYVTYCVRVDGKKFIWYAHALVLTAFVGPRPDGFVACHIDGNPKNNTVANLMWGSHTENAWQKVGHGRHQNANKESCPQGHPYAGGNLYEAPRGDGSRFRQCRACVKENSRRYRARKHDRGAS